MVALRDARQVHSIYAGPCMTILDPGGPEIFKGSRHISSHKLLSPDYMRCERMQQATSYPPGEVLGFCDRWGLYQIE